MDPAICGLYLKELDDGAIRIESLVNMIRLS